MINLTGGVDERGTGLQEHIGVMSLRASALSGLAGGRWGMFSGPGEPLGNVILRGERPATT